LCFESAYIAVWKSKIRKALASSSIETEYNERGRDVPNGFRVRKIFEDGNYYEGQVISGPSRAFDEEKGKMVLCWRVKYLDDDEEEFTVEELDLWGMDKNLVYKDGDSVASSLDAKGTKLVGIVDWEQHRSEEIVSPPKTSSEDNDRSSDASKDITSTDIASTSNYSSGNASSGISSRDFISTGIAYRGNTSIGKKVQDLQFTRTNSAIPDEESKPAKVEKTSKAKSEQNASDWDSSPLAIKPRVSLQQQQQQSTTTNLPRTMLPSSKMNHRPQTKHRSRRVEYGAGARGIALPKKQLPPRLVGCCHPEAKEGGGARARGVQRQRKRRTQRKESSRRPILLLLRHRRRLRNRPPRQQHPETSGVGVARGADLLVPRESSWRYSSTTMPKGPTLREKAAAALAFRCRSCRILIESNRGGDYLSNLIETHV
jgi:hypothetical protein